jgi:hypothetical protein
VGTEGSFSGGKAEREAYRSPPSSAEINNGGAIPPLPGTWTVLLLTLQNLVSRGMYLCDVAEKKFKQKFVEMR